VAPGREGWSHRPGATRIEEVEVDASQLVVRGADLSDRLVREFAAYYLQSPELVRAREEITLRSLGLHATEDEYNRLAEIAKPRTPERR